MKKMILTGRELEAIICNCKLNEEDNDYLRSCIGSALCRKLHDSASDRFDDDEEYKELGDAGFYNCPTEKEIFKCFEYMYENEMIDDELDLNVI